MGFASRRGVLGLMAGAAALSQDGPARGGETRFKATVATGAGSILVHGVEVGGARRGVLVLHGRERNARRYRDQWARIAANRGVAIAAPEFDARRFAGWRGYNLGGLGEADRPDLIAALSELRAWFAERCGLSRVDVYGHSAGAQLVFRYCLFAPTGLDDARLIAANAGWYTTPSRETPFPYGLKGAPREVDLETALARALTLLCGEDDTDRAHHALRRDAGAEAQGPTRLARARHCMNQARETAAALGAPCHWRLETVPEVGHSNASMAPHALDLLGSEPI